MKPNPIVKRTVGYAWDVQKNKLGPKKSWAAICFECNEIIKETPPYYSSNFCNTRKYVKDCLHIHNLRHHKKN